MLNAAAFPGAFPTLLSLSAVKLKMIKITTCMHSNCSVYVCYALGRIRARTWVIELSCHWPFGTDCGDFENFINIFLSLKLLVDLHNNYTIIKLMFFASGFFFFVLFFVLFCFVLFSLIIRPIYHYNHLLVYFCFCFCLCLFCLFFFLSFFSLFYSCLFLFCFL